MYRFAAIPVQEGVVKIRINRLTHYAFLSECPNPVNGETVEILYHGKRYDTYLDNVP